MTASNHEDIDARVARVGEVYVRTADVNRVNKLIALTRKERRDKGRACLCLITGVSGMGKTRIFESYEAKEPKPADGVSLPVLLLSVPSPFTPAAFWMQFLVKLNVPFPSGHPQPGVLIPLVLQGLRRRNVELIMLEEVSHIVDRKAKDAKIPYYVTDMIKLNLLDEAKVPVAMNGVPVASELLRINPQLEMRCLDWIPLLPYDLKKADSKAQFMLLLEVFEVAAGFRKGYLAHNEPLCERVHWATGGIHGKIMKLMKKATRIAGESLADGLSSDVFALACATGAALDEKWINPFLVEKLPSAKLPDESRVTKLHKGKSRQEGAAA